MTTKYAEHYIDYLRQLKGIKSSTEINEIIGRHLLTNDTVQSFIKDIHVIEGSTTDSQDLATAASLFHLLDSTLINMYHLNSQQISDLNTVFKDELPAMLVQLRLKS